MKYNMNSKKLRIGLLASIAVMLCIAAVLVWRGYEQPETITLASESQALRERANDIETSAPDESAPLDERLAYYDQLVQAKRISEDHKGSVAAFESRLKLSEKGLDYLDYLHVSLSYKKLAQKVDALAALDRSEALLPPDNFDEGFFRSEVLEDITKIRSELQ